MTKLEDWLRRYPMVAATLVVALAGLALTLTAPAATRWVVGGYALVVAAMHAYQMVRDMLRGNFGLDILAVTAVVSTVAVGDVWAALIVVLITEAFSIRSVLIYAVGGAIVGAACYLGLVPFDTSTMRFEGIVRRHLEVMTGAGIVAGFIYWLIAGRNAGVWRGVPRPPSLPSRP